MKYEIISVLKALSIFIYVILAFFFSFFFFRDMNNLHWIWDCSFDFAGGIACIYLAVSVFFEMKSEGRFE